MILTEVLLRLSSKSILITKVLYPYLVKLQSCLFEEKDFFGKSHIKFVVSKCSFSMALNKMYWRIWYYFVMNLLRLRKR